MNPLLILFAYALQIWSIVFTARKGWLLGVFFSIYLTLSMAVFDYILSNNLLSLDFMIDGAYFTAMPMWGLRPYAVDTRLVFAAATVAIALCGLGGGIDQRRRGELREAMNAATERLLRGYGVWITAALVALNILNVAHFFSMDFNTIWHNSVYLTIKDPELVGISNPLYGVYHQAFRLIALITILGYFSFSWSRQAISKFLCLAYSLYATVLMLADASRLPIMYAGVAIFSAYAFRRLSVYNAIVLSSSVVLLYAYAIHSRGLDDFGISVIAKNFSELDLNFILESLRGMVVNFAEGALNFANGISTNQRISTEYQLLSLSPLPSFIDGFDFTDIGMINPYVPIGAMAEAYMFDLPAQILYVGVMLLFVRLCFLAARSGGVGVRYMVTFTGMWVAYNLPMYSIRSTWKIVFLMTVVLGLWHLYRASRRELETQIDVVEQPRRAASL